MGRRSSRPTATSKAPPRHNSLANSRSWRTTSARALVTDWGSGERPRTWRPLTPLTPLRYSDRMTAAVTAEFIRRRLADLPEVMPDLRLLVLFGSAARGRARLR